MEILFTDPLSPCPLTLSCSCYKTCCLFEKKAIKYVSAIHEHLKLLQLGANELPISSYNEITLTKIGLLGIPLVLYVKLIVSVSKSGIKKADFSLFRNQMTSPSL